jgi:hypothetical protein
LFVEEKGICPIQKTDRRMLSPIFLVKFKKPPFYRSAGRKICIPFAPHQILAPGQCVGGVMLGSRRARLDIRVI